MTAEQLLDALYAAPPGSGKQAVIMLIRRIREKLPVGLITIDGQYAIDPTCAFVDVWAFEASTSTDPTEAVQLWSEPFGGLDDLPPRLVTKCEELRQLHRTTLEAAAWQIDPESSKHILTQLLAEVTADPRDESLVAAAAAAVYRLGRQTEALKLVQTCHEALLDSGLVASEVLRRVERAILNHEEAVLAVRGDSAATRTLVLSPELPAAFAHPPKRLIGRNDTKQVALKAFDDLVSLPSGSHEPRPPIIVSGVGGAGKTATLAVAVHEAGELAIRIRVGLTSRDDVPYGPLLTALPELAPALEAITTAGDPTIERSNLANEVANTIRVITEDMPLVLIIEDVHQTDVQTLALLRSVVPTALPGNIQVIMSTQPVEPESEVHAFFQNLIATGARVIDLEPLSLADLEEMVAVDHPDEQPVRRAQFAQRLQELSAGNGHVASILSRDAPPGLSTILLPEAISPEESLGSHLRRKIDDPQLEDMLTSAALIGRNFSQELLAHVVNRPVDETAAALDRCKQLGICEYIGGGDWQFDHLLTVNYFTSRMPLLRPLIFARIARHARAPVESMIRYVDGAGDNLPREFAYDTLLRSGRERAAAFAFGDAFAAVNLAIKLAPDDDLTALHIELANYASRSGARVIAQQHRQLAFAAAEDNDDHDAMAQAALAGLPSGEFAGGEPDRLLMLEKVDPTRVTTFTADWLAKSWLRQARLSTKVASVRDLLTKADTMFGVGSTTYDDAKAGHEAMGDDSISLRYEQLVALANAIDAPPIATRLGELAEQLDFGPLRAAIRQSEVIAAVTEGKPNALTVTLQRATTEIHSFGAPRARWLTDVFEASLTRTGKLSVGADADAARLSGLRWGIADVHDNWHVQLWMDAWFDGRYAEALAAMDASRNNIADNVAWRAAEAICAARSGQLDRAQEQVALLLTTLPDQLEGPWTRTAAALLAETATTLDDPAAAELAHTILIGHSGSSIVLGAGVAYLGAVDRYLGLAMSVLSPASARPFLTAAVNMSDGHDGIWTEKARANLAALSS